MISSLDNMVLVLCGSNQVLISWWNKARCYQIFLSQSINHLWTHLSKTPNSPNSSHPAAVPRATSCHCPISSTCVYSRDMWLFGGLLLFRGKFTRGNQLVQIINSNILEGKRSRQTLSPDFMSRIFPQKGSQHVLFQQMFVKGQRRGKVLHQCSDPHTWRYRMFKTSTLWLSVLWSCDASVLITLDFVHFALVMHAYLPLHPYISGMHIWPAIYLYSVHSAARRRSTSTKSPRAPS